jgi:hypothetical protein
VKSQKSIANRWMNQVAGVVLVGMGIVGLSGPTPKVSWHCLEDAAVHRLAPIAKRSQVGRQFLAVYMEREAECHRTI